MPIEIHLPLRDAAKAGTTRPAHDARIDVRVLRSGGGKLELEMHGRTFEVVDPGGLTAGERFTARIERTGTHLILRRADTVTTSAEAQGAPNALGRPGMGVAERALAILSDTLWKLDPGGEAGALFASLRSLLVDPVADKSADAGTIAMLFQLFGVDEPGVMDRLRGLTKGPGPSKALARLLALPKSAWTLEGESPGKTIDAIRSRLASLSGWLESSETANRLLRSLDQPLYVQWPLLGGDEAPVRMTYRRGEKDAEAGADVHGHIVEMMLDTSGLGEVRFRLAAMPGIDLTVRARAEALYAIEPHREALTSALTALAEPVVVRFAELTDDEEPFPDLTHLLARARGEAGRVRMTV
ncbi:MAG: hypothetical protein IT350_10110 [Deltaproteobacteria bacterium]|nr:hypothetical protein [Deltaproteobacteria bacterium]